MRKTIYEILKEEGLWPDRKFSTALDVGCGFELKSQNLPVDFIVGVDAYEPYLIDAVCNKNHALIRNDALAFCEMVVGGSFDIVCLFDIIEHLDRLNSEAVIKSAKRIASKAVVVQVGNGYIPQNIDITGYGGDSWQTHRSGWSAKELEFYGFKCVVRPYKMSNVKRHTSIDIDPNIEEIYAIYEQK